MVRVSWISTVSVRASVSYISRLIFVCAAHTDGDGNIALRKYANMKFSFANIVMQLSKLGLYNNTNRYLHLVSN